jgi:6-phosphogluconolactonase
MKLPKIMLILGENLVSHAMDGAVDQLFSRMRSDREFHVVLTGGRSGREASKYFAEKALKHLESLNLLDSRKTLTIHVWFSDERFTNTLDPERTDSQLIPELSSLATSSRIKVIFHRTPTPADGDVTLAANSYSGELDTVIGNGDFDLVFLSMGEDGHIASLFPGLSTTSHKTNSAVAVDNSPKPPLERVSISVDRLAKARAIYILATGEAKREALEKVRSREAGPIMLLSEVTTAEDFYIYTDIK